jgi:serine/threonine protein kinase
MSSASDPASVLVRCPHCGRESPRTSPHQCQGTVEVPDDGDTQTLHGPSQTTEPQQRDFAQAASLVGTTLGERYQVLSLISQGGMGVVYKARHIALDSMLAIKVLLEPQDATYRKRFLKEAQLASKVRHPNTVYIADFGVLPDGRSYLAMEFLDGPTLGSVLKEQTRLSVLRACHVALQIARGMQQVHDKGIIHRDLKPDNIFLLEHEGSRDFVKIVDFGIAKDTEGAAASRDELPRARRAEEPALMAAHPQSSNDELTAVGTAVGTPRYMAPEVVDNHDIDHRVDQYALGCILYQMLTGVSPFIGSSPAETLRMHQQSAPPPMRERCPDVVVTPELEQVVLRALAKQPEQRFSSMRELAKELELAARPLAEQLGERPNWLAGSKSDARVPVSRWAQRPVLWSAVSSLLVLSIAAGGYTLWRRYADSGSSAALQPGEMATLRTRALSLLVTHVRDQSPELRQSALSALGQTRDVTLFEALQPALRDPIASVQAQAAEALGQLGERKAVPLLLPRLDAKSLTNVRVAAAHALTLLGDGRGHAALTEMLGSSEDDLRLRAAFLLCERANPEALQLLGALVKAGKLPDGMALTALTCLARSGDAASRQQLVEKVEGEGPRDLQIAAATRLAQLGEARGKSFLRSLSEKPGPERLLALRLLASQSNASGEGDDLAAAETFRKLLLGPRTEVPVRLIAIEGLAACGQPLDVRALGEQLLTAPDPIVRHTAAIAILQIAGRDLGTLSSQSLQWARSALGDENWMIRESAVQVLGDSSQRESIPVLASMLKDREVQVRRSAAKALGRSTDQAALLALREGLGDTDTSVRKEALRSIGRLAEFVRRQGESGVAKEVVSWVTGVLKAGSEEEQVLARAALLRMGDASQRAAMHDMQTSNNAAARLLLAEESEGDDGLLISLLNDREFKVRFAAARRLAEVGDPRALPVLDDALARGGHQAISAVGLLRRLGKETQLPADLDQQIEKGSVSERMAALEAAAQLPGTIAVGLFAKAARDREPLVRRLTAELCESLPDGLGLRVLRQLSRDEDAAVRSRASLLLQRLSTAAPVAKVKTPPPAAPKPGPELTLGAPVDAGTAVASSAGVADLGTAAPDGAALLAEAGKRGRGTLMLDAPAGTLFQLDGRPWQKSNGQPLLVPAGPHRVVTLSGGQEVTVAANAVAHVSLKESQSEQMVRSGIEAFERKDYRQAQKLLEKSQSLCGRDSRYLEPCKALGFAASARLGDVYEKQERWADAMAEYQKIVKDSGSGGSNEVVEQRRLAQEGIKRLSAQLGKVVILRRNAEQCRGVTIWMIPGTHDVEIDGASQSVLVKAGDTVRVGTCP